jgi:hypothetical protein
MILHVWTSHNLNIAGNTEGEANHDAAVLIKEQT